jgi:hypothetical protein
LSRGPTPLTPLGGGVIRAKLPDSDRETGELREREKGTETER